MINLSPWDIRIKINGKKLEPITHVKYLGIPIDSHLNWKFHVDDLSTKLSRSVGMHLPKSDISQQVVG